MANIFENKDRRVIPNWRSFKKTAILGELDSNTQSKKRNLNLASLEDYIEDWITNKTIAHAGDLISAATVNGVFNNEHIHEAAKFIISNKNQSTNLQQQFATKIIQKEKQTDLLHKLENISLDDFNFYVNKELVYKKITELKSILNLYPYNPILYVELSRNYSILGQLKPSIASMQMALKLSPSNRFILRSAVRLFAHIGDLEYSHDLLRKNSLTNIDPWLTSAEISLATLRDRRSMFIKKGMEMVNSKKLSPFSITELSSSLGTVELLHGNLKKSRPLFQTSMISPNDNSLAQIEWASSKDNNLNIIPTTLQVNHNFEALALENFHNKKLNEALDYTFRWFLDMPFSKRPIMFGAHIASSLLYDQEKSRGFLKAGLISHPNDPQIINNLVYSLALENNTNEALSYLNKLPQISGVEKSTQICLTATRGLVFFRSGFHEEGRKNYLKAIEEAKELKSQYYTSLAFLNYAREEIIINSGLIESVIDVVKKIPESKTDLDINELKHEVLHLYSKIKRQN